MHERCPFCNGYNTIEKESNEIEVFFQSIIIFKINHIFCNHCNIDFSTHDNVQINSERLKKQKQQLIAEFREKFIITTLDGVFYDENCFK